MIYIQLEDVAHPIWFEEATTTNCDAICVLASFGRARNWRRDSRLDRSAAQPEFRNERPVTVNVVIIEIVQKATAATNNFE